MDRPLRISSREGEKILHPYLTNVREPFTKDPLERFGVVVPDVLSDGRDE